MPFRGIRLAEAGGQALQEAISTTSCGVGMCLGDLQLALTRPDLLLVLDLAGLQYEVVWLQGADVLTC